MFHIIQVANAVGWAPGTARLSLKRSCCCSAKQLSFGACTSGDTATTAVMCFLYYLTPNGSAKYHGEHVCLYMCLLACLKNYMSKLHEIFCTRYGHVLVAFSALTLLVGGRKGIQPVKNMRDGGGGHRLVWMEWRPARWSVCLHLLIPPCTIKSRSSLLAPVHPGCPGKRAVKRLWWWLRSWLSSLMTVQYIMYFRFCLWYHVCQ